MKNFVLDSYAVISYLNGETGALKISEFFEMCVAENMKAMLCDVNLGEVYYHALRVADENKAQLAVDIIRALPIEIVEPYLNLTLQAASYKAFNKISYAAAFAAALAKLNKATLVTGDKDFKVLENEIKITWI